MKIPAWIWVAVVLAICWPFEVTRNLLFGWIYYIARVFPEIEVNWMLVIIGAMAWIGIVLMVHHLARWWQQQSRAEGGDRGEWSFRSSLCIGSFVVVMFCAGIAAAGVTHQTAWLLRSPNPFWVTKINSWGATDFASTRIQLSDLDRGINMYGSSYKRLPFTAAEDEQVRRSWPTKIVAFMYSHSKVVRHGDLPWDHEKNRDYYSKVFPDLLNPSLESAPQHNSQGYGLSHFEANQHIDGMSYEDFRSGLSHTLVIGEVQSKFQPWGKPDTDCDPELGLNRHADGFGGPASRDTVLFLFADGSVRAISDTIDPTVLRAMSRP